MSVSISIQVIDDVLSIPFVLSFCNEFPVQFQFQIRHVISGPLQLYKDFTFLYLEVLINFNIYSVYVE